jgi:hypothetical protein
MKETSVTVSRIGLLALLVLPSIGCRTLADSAGYETHPVEEQFRPLETITERPNYVLPETAITTVGTTAYVVSLDVWLGKHPPGSTTYTAKLLHEQEHSKRQLKEGTLGWVARYVVDTDFMWEEEQRGWYLELIHLRNNGLDVNVDVIAMILHGYKNAVGKRMVSFVEARLWVLDVLAGRWTHRN